MSTDSHENPYITEEGMLALEQILELEEPTGRSTPTPQDLTERSSVSAADEAYSSTKTSIDLTLPITGQHFPWEVAYLTRAVSLDVSSDSIADTEFVPFLTIFTQEVTRYTNSCPQDTALSIQSNCDAILRKYSILCTTYIQAKDHAIPGQYSLSSDVIDHATPYLKILDLITYFFEGKKYLPEDINYLTNAIKTSLSSISDNDLATGHAMDDMRDLNCIKHVYNKLKDVKNQFSLAQPINKDLIKALAYEKRDYVPFIYQRLKEVIIDPLDTSLSKICLDTTIDIEGLNAFLAHPLDPLSTSRDADDEDEEHSDAEEEELQKIFKQTQTIYDSK